MAKAPHKPLAALSGPSVGKRYLNHQTKERNMKLEIYSEQLKMSERITRLRLEKSGDEISIVAVRENGSYIDSGHLMRFFPGGQIRLFQHVNPDLGFDLDEEGRIKIQ